MAPIVKQRLHTSEQRIGGAGDRKDTGDVVVGGVETKPKGRKQRVPLSRPGFTAAMACSGNQANAATQLDVIDQQLIVNGLTTNENSFVAALALNRITD